MQMYKNFSFEKTGRVMTLSKLQENQFSVAQCHNQKGNIQFQSPNKTARLRVNSDQFTDLRHASMHSQSTKTMSQASPRNQFNNSEGFSKIVFRSPNASPNHQQSIRRNIEKLQSLQVQNQQPQFQNSRFSNPRSVQDSSSTTDSHFNEKIQLEKSTQQIFYYHDKREEEAKMKNSYSKDIQFIQKQIYEEQRILKDVKGVCTVVHQQQQKIDENTNKLLQPQFLQNNLLMQKFSEQLHKIKKEKASLQLDIKRYEAYINQVEQRSLSILEQIDKEKQLIESLKNDIANAKGVSYVEQEEQTNSICSKAVEYTSRDIK